VFHATVIHDKISDKAAWITKKNNAIKINPGPSIGPKGPRYLTYVIAAQVPQSIYKIKDIHLMYMKIIKATLPFISWI
jgi:hypothetical protein